MHQFFGRRTGVEGALIRLFEDHYATAFDLRIVGGDRCSDKVCKCNVGDEASALFNLQPGLLTFAPTRQAHFAVEHSSIDAHVRNWLGEYKCAAPGSATVSVLRRSGQAHIVRRLLRGSALMNGRQRQKSRQAGAEPLDFFQMVFAVRSVKWLASQTEIKRCDFYTL